MGDNINNSKLPATDEQSTSASFMPNSNSFDAECYLEAHRRRQEYKTMVLDPLRALVPNKFKGRSTQKSVNEQSASEQSAYPLLSAVFDKPEDTDNGSDLKRTKLVITLPKAHLERISKLQDANMVKTKNQIIDQYLNAEREFTRDFKETYAATVDYIMNMKWDIEEMKKKKADREQNRKNGVQ